MSHLTEELQQVYCLGDNTGCARYRIVRQAGKSAVPELMLPNQHRWAEEIIRESKNS